MRKLLIMFCAAVFLFTVVLAVVPAQIASAQAQPLLYVHSYSPGPNTGVSPWEPFTFTFEIGNNGASTAKNVVITFSSEDFIPLEGYRPPGKT